MPDDTWSIQGPHFMNCNCEYGCPCQFWGRPTDGTCRAVLALRQEGAMALDTPRLREASSR